MKKKFFVAIVVAYVTFSISSMRTAMQPMDEKKEPIDDKTPIDIVVVPSNNSLTSSSLSSLTSLTQMVSLSSQLSTAFPSAVDSSVERAIAMLSDGIDWNRTYGKSCLGEIFDNKKLVCIIFTYLLDFTEAEEDKGKLLISILKNFQHKDIVISNNYTGGLLRFMNDSEGMVRILAKIYRKTRQQVYGMNLDERLKLIVLAETHDRRRDEICHVIKQILASGEIPEKGTLKFIENEFDEGYTDVPYLITQRDHKCIDPNCTPLCSCSDLVTCCAITPSLQNCLCDCCPCKRTWYCPCSNRPCSKSWCAGDEKICGFSVTVIILGAIITLCFVCDALWG